MRLKSILTIFLLSVVFSISGCYHVNRRTNYLFECDFSKEQDGITYFLKVERISKETYESAKGLNVINDALYRDHYFSFNFYSWNREEKTQYDFFNLRDPHPKVTSQPIIYIDDSYNGCMPDTDYYNTIEFNYIVDFGEVHLRIGGIEYD